MKKTMNFKVIAALIAVMMLLIFANANAQGIKISALPTLSAPDSSADYIPIVHSGTTYKVTPGTLFHEFGASGGSGSPGGSTTHIQYNNAGAFAGSSDFTWNNTSKLFKVSSSALYADGFFKANLNSYYGFLGDSAGANNGTYLEVNDDDRVISLIGNTIKIGLGGTALDYHFPETYGDVGSVLVDVDGAGTLAWAGFGGAAGSDGEIQFNDGDAFAASPDLYFDAATNDFHAGDIEGSRVVVNNSTDRFIDLIGQEAGSGPYNRFHVPSPIDGSGFYYGSFYSGSLYRALLIAGDTWQMGDIDNASNGSLFTIDNGNSKFIFNRAIQISPFGTSAGNTSELRFLELAANGTNYTGFKSPDSRSANLIYTLPSTDPTSGQVLSSGAPSGGVAALSWISPSGSGTVTSIATTSPITGGTITTTGTIGIDNAAADGTTKGAASFTAADFNSSSGLISIDYTNAQSASTSTKGFLTDTDWDTFNDKLAATGTMTGATSQRQDFTNGIGVPLIDDDGAGSIELSFSTVTKAVFSTGGLQISPDGSAASPSLALGSNNHGFYEKTSTELGVSIQGALVGGFNTAGLFINTIDEYSTNNGVTIDGVNLKDGLVVGQYGGTGVANTGKTITLGGNLTTSGAHATTFTTIGTTNVTLPTTGTIPTLDGTETFTNKSIVATQLTGTAYTFGANNTNSTAAYTLQRYEDHDLATYSGTVDFNGTDPSSITSQQYAWSRIGNTVTLFFSIFYGTPGTTNTSATFTLPSDCPSPVTFATGGDAASEYIFPISGARIEANMTANPSAVRGGLRRNAANDGYEIALIFGSVSAAHASFTLTYRTQ
jgi:hypothetical protein